MARELPGCSSKAARLCVYGECTTSVNVFLTAGERWELFFRLSVFLSDASCLAVSVTRTA